MSDVTERSVPKVQFTDAEAGAKEFPDSNARRYNYFEPAKRKQQLVQLTQSWSADQQPLSSGQRPTSWAQQKIL